VPFIPIIGAEIDRRQLALSKLEVLPWTGTVGEMKKKYFLPLMIGKVLIMALANCQPISVFRKPRSI